MDEKNTALNMDLFFVVQILPIQPPQCSDHLGKESDWILVSRLESI
jgi:hypothetical protein